MGGSRRGIVVLFLLVMTQSMLSVEAKCNGEGGSGGCSHSSAPSSSMTKKTVSYSSEHRAEEGSNSSQSTSYEYSHGFSSGDNGTHSYTHHRTSNSSFSMSSNSSSYSSHNMTQTIIVELGHANKEASTESVEEHAMASEAAEAPAESLPAIDEPTVFSVEQPAPPPTEPSQPEHLPSQSEKIAPAVSVQSPPLQFYPCGYAKPIDPRDPDASSKPQFYSFPDGWPCPMTPPNPVPSAKPSPETSPYPAKPVPVVQPSPDPPKPIAAVESSPEAPRKPIPVVPSSPDAPKPILDVQSPPPSPVVLILPPELPAERRDSAATAKKVKDLIASGNFTELAEFVIESDDIYGLNMGLRFSEEDREEELVKTAERTKDKDVITIKALALAALNPKATGKVIQLMVLTATSPDGYHFTEHRALVVRFTKIFLDTELLKKVVASDPQVYLKRRLLCAGCTPINTYICAHCWPKRICNAHFWCPTEREALPSRDSMKQRKPSEPRREAVQPSPISKPVPPTSPQPRMPDPVPAVPSSSRSKRSSGSPSKQPEKRRGKQKSRRRRNRRRGKRSIRVRSTKQRNILSTPNKKPDRDQSL